MPKQRVKNTILTLELGKKSSCKYQGYINMEKHKINTGRSKSDRDSIVMHWSLEVTETDQQFCANFRKEQPPE